MPIQILPARLANQIAAGEVVERPSSVVKELVENSLDAGATRIEIDIEKGGAKCIRITDNGKGVGKDELTLALSRHATSKISHLDDLDAIVSLGFRGEALASVSSVSRLTFTSKPQDQEEAWQAVAEGRDMQVNVQPAAHPQGTTVEVLDLFFNTPARRRFLKTEKTEFQHIDELIRRIALSSFDISFILKHNGKIVRQYRAAQTQVQIEKRLSAICSESFVKSALHFESKDNHLKISGWMSDRLSPRALSDVQYCYINGRMIRDKLVNHAIKQVYAYVLPEGKFPGYVIYLECDPNQVDVNVHPSKHEVRFHEARWVHDFIVSALTETLSQAPLNQYLLNTENEVSLTPAKSAPHDYCQAPEQIDRESQKYQGAHAASTGNYSNQYSKPSLDNKQVDAYCNFVNEAQFPIAETVNTTQNEMPFAQPVSVIKGDYLLLKLADNQQLLKTQSSLIILSLNRADAFIKQNQLFEAWENGEVIAQPLLLPVRIEIESRLLQICNDFNLLFERLGFSLKTQGNKLIISKVPPLLRQAPLAKIFPILLDHLSLAEQTSTDVEVKAFCAFIVKTLHHNLLDKKNWSEQSANSLLTLLVSLFPEHLQNQKKSLFHEPDLSLLLQGFSDEQ